MMPKVGRTGTSCLKLSLLARDVLEFRRACGRGMELFEVLVSQDVVLEEVQLFLEVEYFLAGLLKSRVRTQLA
jgi:hypothetical protein